MPSASGRPEKMNFDYFSTFLENMRGYDSGTGTVKGTRVVSREMPKKLDLAHITDAVTADQFQTDLELKIFKLLESSDGEILTSNLLKELPVNASQYSAVFQCLSRMASSNFITREKVGSKSTTDEKLTLTTQGWIVAKALANHGQQSPINQ